MAEEQKLGPNVTYLGNEEGDKQAVTMVGVRFKPGESVNLEERLGKTQAKAVLQKLAGNTFFKVDGGVDHRAEQKQRAEAEQKAAEAEQKAAEAEQKEREEEAKQASDPNNPNYQAPERATLEKQSGGPPPYMTEGKTAAADDSDEDSRTSSKTASKTASKK